jgi:hypothetical protein
LIGEVLSVEGDYALKLMEPRDESSWLEILRLEGAAASGGGAEAPAGGEKFAGEGRDSAAVPPSSIGQLVETTIVAFVDHNLFGMIKGSTSSPSHTAVAEWLDHKINGKRLVPKKEYALVAEPALSKMQRVKPKAANGVREATGRVSTTKATALEEAGSTTLGGTLKHCPAAATSRRRSPADRRRR